MYDYMKSLHRQFFREPACEDLRREIEQTRQELRDQMDKDSRRKLLCLTDCQAALREEVSLHSFLAGYRLACGIGREEERRGTELYELERWAAETAHAEEE